MSCEETQALIHGYLDGELDLVRSMEIQRHLETCRNCALLDQNQQALRSLVRDGSLYFRAPAGLEQRIRAGLGEAHQSALEPLRMVPPAAAGPSTRARRLGRRTWTPHWAWIGLAAAAAVAVIFLALLPRLSRPSGEELLADEVVSSHIRSLMPNHLTDVLSSDQHTVKPWFDGRLDFSPPVVDLGSEGFPLVGGRLDYLAGRPVAALVYGRRKHLINVFVWPSPSGSDSGPLTKVAARQGYNVVRWTKSGMTYWAVSDVNAKDLEHFAQLLRGQ